MTPVAIAVVVILIALNALYVAGEFAAVGARPGRVQERAERGNALAARLLPILKDTGQLDAYIATCQIGITFSSLVLGAYGQVAFTPGLAALVQERFGVGDAAALSSAAVVVLVTLTMTQVVLGELVPKSIALQFPTRAALATLIPVAWSRWLFAPFIWLLNGSASLALRAFRVPAGSHRHVHSPEEIEMLVAESRSGGLLEPEEHRRLTGALHLRRLPARKLMVPREKVLAVAMDAPLDHVVRIVAEAPYTRIPVYQGAPERIVGFLHTKDVFLKHATNGGGLTIQDLLRPIKRVPEDLPGDRLLAALREARAQIAVVENASGDALGIVTIEDILAEMIGAREEVKRAG